MPEPDELASMLTRVMSKRGSALMDYNVPDLPYYITGTDTPHELAIRNIVNAINPNQLPDQISILPTMQYRAFVDKLSRGQIQGMRVNHEGVGNAVSLGGRIWMDNAILDDPYKLPHAVAHEMKHRELNTSNEDKTERATEEFMKMWRAKASK